MRSNDIVKALDSVGQKWTRQIKSEEKRPAAFRYRESMYTVSRVSLKSICHDNMEKVWNKASNNGALPAHWRQMFYIMRPICEAHPESDRPLIDTTFKQILEKYLADYRPGWDVVRGARGAFKEPHRARNDTGLAMSTLNVRSYVSGWRTVSTGVEAIDTRYPTKGPTNRIAAVLICEKEGFDELLEAAGVVNKYDLALMSTKGISAYAARDLADQVGVPCFTLHDLDKNGFVMAAGFSSATDLGIRLLDVEEWGLQSESQHHRNRSKTYNNLIHNGATPQEADYIADGQRVELNMFTSNQLVDYVQQKLDAARVEKVTPGEVTLANAWRRIHLARKINNEIEEHANDDATFDPPDNLRDQIKAAFEESPSQSWDLAIADIASEDEEDDNND